MKISLNNAVGDFFETKEKWLTWLLLTVCQLIPLVGPMVMIGYFTRRFALTRSGEVAPDFKFDDFSDYLQIGLWPTLAYFLVSVCAMPLILLAEIPMFIAMIKLGAESESMGPVSMAPLFAAMAVTYSLMIFISILLMLLASPIVLRSSLMKSFQAGFAMSVVIGFIKKVGLSYLLWMVVLWFIAAVASLLGMLAFFIGAIFVGTLAMYAGFHLLYQHYDLYLERGGEEIEVHPDVMRSASVRPPLPKISGGDSVG